MNTWKDNEKSLSGRSQISNMVACHHGRVRLNMVKTGLAFFLERIKNPSSIISLLGPMKAITIFVIYIFSFVSLTFCLLLCYCWMGPYFLRIKYFEIKAYHMLAFWLLRTFMFSYDNVSLVFILHQNRRNGVPFTSITCMYHTLQASLTLCKEHFCLVVFSSSGRSNNSQVLSFSLFPFLFWSAISLIASKVECWVHLFWKWNPFSSLEASLLPCW